MGDSKALAAQIYERVGDAVDDALPWRTMPEVKEAIVVKVFTALGLDDLDAAVERGASAIASANDYNPNKFPPDEWANIKARYEFYARAVLEAACTAATDDTLGEK